MIAVAEAASTSERVLETFLALNVAWLWVLGFVVLFIGLAFLPRLFAKNEK